MLALDPPLDPRLEAALRDVPVWVSGGAGFIGSRLVTLARLHGARLHLFDGDVRDPDQVAASIAACAPAALFHLAAPVDVTRDEALAPRMEATILRGSMAVADAAQALPRRPLLVHVGTCEEYGTIDAPFAEDDEPSEPVSPYARFKLLATRELLRRARERALRVVVARPFLTYGPGQRSAQLVPAAIRAARTGQPFEMTRGLQTRELNHVDDTALGLLRCAAAPALEGGIVNVAGGDERAVLEVVRTIFRLADAPQSLIRAGARPTRSGEVPRFFADVCRCRELLGHTPRFSLEEGLARTIEAWTP